MSQVRDRMLRAAVLTDARLMRVSRDARVFGLLLDCIAENTGVFVNDPASLRCVLGAALMDDDDSLPSCANVQTWIDELIGARFLISYEGDGARLLYLKNVTRLGGADRFETAVEVAQWAVEAKGHSWDRAGIATGLDFADALTGGILQGEMRSVTLLTRPGVLNPHTHAALVANKNVIHTLTFFGGTGAVSPAVRAAALSAAD